MQEPTYELLKAQALFDELLEGIKIYSAKLLHQIRAYEKNYPNTPLNRSVYKVDGRTYSINVVYKDGRKYVNRIRLLR